MSKAPIVPIAIQGSRDVMPKHSRWIQGGHIVLNILPPVATDGREVGERADLMDEVRRPIAAALAVGE
jgi:1-acyl-sn-glycerol-3-phosphate acyltransferase